MYKNNFLLYTIIIGTLIEIIIFGFLYLTTNKIKQEYRSLDTRINLLEMSVVPGYFDKK